MIQKIHTSSLTKLFLYWILVFDQGRVVQSGVHEALLEQDGIYQALWRKQQDLSQSKESVPSL